MSKLVLLVGDKQARLNPYKRITKGTTLIVTVDGVEKEVIQDLKAKYTYLNVNGTDYYITGTLTEGESYETSEWVPAVPKAKAAKPVELIPAVDEVTGEPVVDEETGEPVMVEAPKKPKRSKKKAAEGEAAAA